MEYSFQAIVELSLEHTKGREKSQHMGTSFTLIPSDGLDEKAYINEDGLPNEEGCRVLTNVLVHGLLGNIHLCHDRKYRDSAEHLRAIITELEKGFVEVATIETGIMEV